MEDLPHRIPSGATPEQRAEDEAIHARFRPGIGLDELVAIGEMTADEAQEIRRQKAAGPPDRPARAIVAALRAERERQGLSLADVAGRTGLDPAALHRLEIGLDKNPTVAALERYAAALGKRITMAVEDLAGRRRAAQGDSFPFPSAPSGPPSPARVMTVVVRSVRVSPWGVTASISFTMVSLPATHSPRLGSKVWTPVTSSWPFLISSGPYLPVMVSLPETSTSIRSAAIRRGPFDVVECALRLPVGHREEAGLDVPLGFVHGESRGEGPEDIHIPGVTRLRLHLTADLAPFGVEREDDQRGFHLVEVSDLVRLRPRAVGHRDLPAVLLDGPCAGRLVRQANWPFGDDSRVIRSIASSTRSPRRADRKS